MTIVEKFEHYAFCGFAVVLLMEVNLAEQQMKNCRAHARRNDSRAGSFFRRGVV